MLQTWVIFGPTCLYSLSEAIADPPPPVDSAVALAQPPKRARGRPKNVSNFELSKWLGEHRNGVYLPGEDELHWKCVPCDKVRVLYLPFPYILLGYPWIFLGPVRSSKLLLVRRSVSVVEWCKPCARQETLAL